MRNLHRRLAVLTLPVALTLAACGGGTSAEPTPTAVATAASPAATAEADASQVVADAIAATRAQGTAQAMFQVESLLTIDGEPWSNEAEGQVDLANGFSRIGWMSPTSPNVTVTLATQDGNFVRVGGENDGQWFVLAEGQTVPLIAAGDVFRGFEGVPFERNDVAEGIDAGTAYTAIVELDNMGINEYAAGMGISLEDPAVLTTADAGSIELTVVVNDEGLVVEVMRWLQFSWSGGDAQASSTVHLIELGTEVNLEAPPADEVQPAPESQQ